MPTDPTFSRYFKAVPTTTIDVYRVLTAFKVTDPCIQHAVKKLLAAGKRGAKDAETDIREAIVSLERWQEMRREEMADAAKALCDVPEPPFRDPPLSPCARTFCLNGGNIPYACTLPVGHDGKCQAITR